METHGSEPPAPQPAPGSPQAPEADAGAERGFVTPEGGLEHRSSATPANSAVVAALELV